MIQRYLLAIFSFTFLILVAASSYAKNDKILIGYVACKDKRIYIIDLYNGQLLHKSDPIKDMGKPTSIDISGDGEQLYVASERGRWQLDYSPIMVLSVKETPIEVVNRINLKKEDSNDYSSVSGVYNIVVSPNGKQLFAGYSHPDYANGTTVIDSMTGEILRKLDFNIDKGSFFSPDSRKVAEIWPGGSRKYLKNGKEYVKSWSGGVAIFDLVRNVKESHKELAKDNIGLNPEWEKLQYPFVYLRNYKIAVIYQRDSGKMISKIDIGQITGGLSTKMRFPVTFDNSRKIILSMEDNDNQGFVAILDLVEKKVVQKIKVGENPSNVVIRRVLHR